MRAARAAISDPRVFEHAIHSPDPEAAVAASDLLTGLRGKDVIIAVVESYGQVAVRGTSFSPGVDAVLRQRTGLLARAGWSTQSAWLTSPTFGGISWLAHSTLQSGLWVNSPQRYGELLNSKRFTLSDAFKKAGWHTVTDDPSDYKVGWPAGSYFYHYDQLYVRLDRDRPGQRLLQVSLEARRPDRLSCTAHTAQQRGVPPGVEGLRRTLAVQQPQPGQGSLGEVEAVHRQVRRRHRRLRHQPRGVRRLAGPRRAGDAQDASRHAVQSRPPVSRRCAPG